VRPTELMLGKVIGIGLVGLTQYAIWSVLAMNLALLSGSGLAAALGFANATIPTVPISTLGYFVLFFVLGYFFYASIYTAIGAPFNSDQEAQQLAMIPTLMIVSVWAFWGLIVNNPNSTLATVLSMIPPLTPMVMFFRVTLAPVPGWQVALATATRRPADAGLPELAELVSYGASPRGPISVTQAARALALLRGRDYVTAGDIRALAKDSLRHRLVLSYTALAENVSADAILDRVLAAVPVPEVSPARPAAA